jgi:hypothetical protein
LRVCHALSPHVELRRPALRRHALRRWHALRRHGLSPRLDASRCASRAMQQQRPCEEKLLRLPTLLLILLTLLLILLTLVLLSMLLVLVLLMTLVLLSTHASDEEATRHAMRRLRATRDALSSTVSTAARASSSAASVTG